MSLSTY